MQSRGNAYAVIFTTLLSLVCALLLTGFKVALAERQERNKRIDKMKNVLGVLKVDYDPAAGAEAIEAAYTANVVSEKRGPLEVYTYKSASGPQAYAFGVEGMGLWDKVFGLLAVEPDLKTIRGVRFYAQQETPGLGGRISEHGFTQQFEGKSIYGSSGKPGIRITKPGKASAANEVDGITGATLTCDGVQKLMNKDIEAFLAAMKAPQTKCATPP